VTGVVALFLLMDGAMKLLPLPQVIETTGQLGWPTDAATLRTIGLLLLASTFLYVYPRTALLGAILLTGYLGGAIATHARIGSPLATHTFFGLYLAIMVWAGLWLRSPRLRSLLPLSH
jgi:hypothetical protein